MAGFRFKPGGQPRGFKVEMRRGDGSLPTGPQRSARDMTDVKQIPPRTHPPTRTVHAPRGTSGGGKR